MMDIDMESGEGALQFNLKKTKKLRKHGISSNSVEVTRRKQKLSKEDKKNIYMISKLLERMSSYERNNLLNALNIDSQSLMPKSEQEFKRECDTLETA